MTGTISGKRQQRLRFEMKFMVVIILDDREPELACKVQQPKPALGPQRNGGRELVVRRHEHRAHRLAAAGPLDRFDVDPVLVEESEARRVGQGGVSRWRSRWWPE